MEDGYITIQLNPNNLNNFGGANLKRQAQSVLDCGHLLQVGVAAIGSTVMVIDAICLQSSHPKEKPHHIQISTHPIWSNWRFNCSCKAGLDERCKHILAVLFYIEKYKRLQVLSCTQLQQKWDKVPKEIADNVLNAERIRDFDEVKHKMRKVDTEITPEERVFINSVLFAGSLFIVALE